MHSIFFLLFKRLKCEQTQIPFNWCKLKFILWISGRRSRRNSISDDSQLTIENFGGSQDQLNMIGRAFEREKSFVNTVIGKNSEYYH